MSVSSKSRFELGFSLASVEDISHLFCANTRKDRELKIGRKFFQQWSQADEYAT